MITAQMVKAASNTKQDGPPLVYWKRVVTNVINAIKSKPVYQVQISENHWIDVPAVVVREGTISRVLYTQSPAPKAEWDDNYEPLNLVAAAMDVVEAWDDYENDGFRKTEKAIAKLHEFIGEESCE